MKSAFEIFVLTKREQRAIILIMMALVAAAITNHYRDHHSEVIPVRSTVADPSATPVSNSPEDQNGEPSESP